MEKTKEMFMNPILVGDFKMRLICSFVVYEKFL